MMVDTFPPQKRGQAFAAYGMVVIGGPILGPSLGGWITDNYSWHWVFLINLPIGLLSLFLVNIYVNDDDVRYLDGLNTPVPAGAEVSILPAVAGG